MAGPPRLALASQAPGRDSGPGCRRRFAPADLGRRAAMGGAAGVVEWGSCGDMNGSTMTADAAQRLRRRDSFLAQAGWGAAEIRLLAGDASFRHYDRLSLGGRTAVLMDAPPPMENVRPFIRIGRLLKDLGFSAPEIYAEDA